MVKKDIPLFCVETVDNVSKLPIFVNVFGSNKIQCPEEDLHQDMLTLGIMYFEKTFESWRLPINLGAIYWKLDPEKDVEFRPKGYVIDTKLNYDFAIRRIMTSEVIRHYIITVALSAIEKKFNQEPDPKKYGQFIGHELDLDVSGYKVLDCQNLSSRSEQLVNNKVTFLDTINHSFTNNFKIQCDTNEPDYTFFYRPRSKILTCVLSCDNLPSMIAYNDDRIVVKNEEESLMDIHLPFFIDLKEPMKYKFDDRSCTIKMVFSITESSTSQS